MEKFIQISSNDRYLFGLTNKGRVFRLEYDQLGDKYVWKEVELPAEDKYEPEFSAESLS